MEWKRDHRLNLREIYIYYSIIVCNISRTEFLICFRSVMSLIPILSICICLPDRRKTGCLSCHYIYSDTEVAGKLIYTRAYELHNTVLNIAILKCCSDKCKCNVLRTYTLLNLTIKIDSNNLRRLNIIGSSKELLSQLTATLTDGHSTERAITCVAVRAKYHSSTLSKLFTSILMNNRLMRRNIDTTILLCS